MPSSRWKGVELAIAKIFGCKRRGPDFRGPSGGNDDLVHPHYSVEVKHLARPTYGQMFAACKQAEQAAHGREPVAVIHKKHAPIDDALVVMRLQVFKEWRIGDMPAAQAQLHDALGLGDDRFMAGEDD